MKRNAIEQRAATIFYRAAAYIRRYGWQEEGMGEPGGPRCSMGALDSAQPRGSWNKQLAKIMYDELNQELHGLSLTQFNHKTQSGEAVARLYERVARKLERQHLQSVR